MTPLDSWNFFNMSNATSERRVLLVDNGSLEPASTLQLRRLARELALRVRCQVEPVSLAHSDKISPTELEGEPAQLLEPAIERALSLDAVDEIIVTPAFFGPSYAITRHVPALLAEREKKFPGRLFRLAAPLYAANDNRLAAIVAEQVQREIAGRAGVRVAIVDHGSPNRAVIDVRNRVADEVRVLLGTSAVQVTACSMERRAGAEFDFNEPMLATLFNQPEWQRGDVVLGMLFIGPGRHAGPGGDVEAICRTARGERGMDSVRISRLVGEHPRLIEILADRVNTAAQFLG